MRKNRVLKKCEGCGNDFLTYPELSSSPTKKFCNRECYLINRPKLIHSKETREKISLANKRYYDEKGRISSTYKRIRSTKKYNTWRKSIFERDEYTCKFCNASGVELNADHIIPFSKIINDFKDITGLKDLELESELMNHIPLWDIENGRTLCVPCHRKTDSYGRNIPTN